MRFIFKKKKDSQQRITLQYFNFFHKKSVSKEKAEILMATSKRKKIKQDWKNMKRTYKIKIFEN